MNRFPIENIDKVAAAVSADSASSATQLANSKNIKLTGDVTGSASFNGTTDASITATVADDSHNHVISNIDNLQTNLDTLSTNITNAKNASITGLSVSGKVITYTKGDGTTGTITTQDTDTTYSVATTSANGLMSSTDKTNLNSAIKSITRSGTTFTYTKMDGSTGTFTQQDNDTTYSAGTGISISGTTISNSGVTSVNGSTGAVTVAAGLSNRKVFTSSGTFTTPKTGNYIFLLVNGGNGGKKPKYLHENPYYAGTGAIGSSVRYISLYLAANLTVTCTVGAGGAGATTAGSSGDAGGVSSITISGMTYKGFSVHEASSFGGSAGGWNGSGTVIAAGAGSSVNGGAGGTGGTGNCAGGGGGGGVSLYNVTSPTAGSGGNGTSGNGGKGGSGFGAGGGGGGGGNTPGNGGNGAAGVVVIYY